MSTNKEYLVDIYNAYAEAFKLLPNNGHIMALDVGDGDVLAFDFTHGRDLSDKIAFYLQLQDEILDFTYFINDDEED